MMASSKTVVAIHASSLTNGATGTGNIDTLGYAFAEVDVISGSSNAVTNKPSVLKISHSDTTDSTNFSDLSGFVGGTDFTIPNAVVSGDQLTAKMRIDLRGRKRYLKVTVSPVTTQTFTAVANLRRGKESPDNESKSGAAVLVGE